MKNIIIGLILGFALTLPFTARAGFENERELLREIIYILEDISDNGDEIISKIDTAISAIERCN